MQRLLTLTALTALTPVLTAQSTLVIPNGTATAEGNGTNAFPWGRGGSGIRIQYIYDGANFTNQAITTPIMISRLRWRPNTNVSSLASSYANGGTVKLSTSPLDYTATSTTMSNNVGSDETTVFSGPVSWPAAAAQPGPSPFLIDIPLSTNYYYDPARGDLNIETELPIQTFTGSAVQLDHQGAGSLSSRAYVTAGYTNGAANNIGLVNQNLGAVVELTYTPAVGLFARFKADVTRGVSPLTVNFTDESWTSDAGGITSWAWDFDGDNIVDSTQRLPTWTYNNCGDFTVSLTVTDGLHPSSTFSAVAYVRTDEIVADFTVGQLVAPNVYQFTDTTTPAATAWAWDFDGDNITDSTQQNPAWALPLCQLATVRLAASYGCRTATKTMQVYSAPATLPTISTSNTSMLSGHGLLFDIQVTNPQGVNICAFEHAINSAPATFTTDVYVTPGTYVGNDTNAAAWRLVGTGTSSYPGTPLCLSQLSSPIYLPQGSYGIAFYHSASTGARLQSNPAVTGFSNADLAVASGIRRTTLFGGTSTANCLWPGKIHYDTAGLGATAGYGFFGAGCAGSMGISKLTANRPQVGTTLNVTVNNMPFNAAFMLAGFSRTMSLFGPLPFDVSVFGAPGCYGRASTEACLLMLGANNTAVWSFAIPNDPVLLGMQMYNQAIVLDTGWNALGAVLSDAAAMLIGN